MMKTLNTNKKGFTLVELLVVIAIIAILSVTAYIALGGQTGNARDSRRMQDLTSIQSVVDLYHIQNNSQYPDNLEALVADGKLTKMPLDPSSNEPYAYALSDDKKQYELGATLEGEKGPYKAYVIGNSEKPLLEGFTPGTDNNCNSIEDKDEDCVPMKIWN